MNDTEPTAIRDPRLVSGQEWWWHRLNDQNPLFTACAWSSLGLTKEVLLSQTDSLDRCRICWPTTKETR